MSKPRGASERSRSPTVEPPDIQIDVAARAILAPLYVEPGAAGDELGIEGRHRSNMGKLFDYLAHVERVTNENADLIDGLSCGSRVFKRANHDIGLEFSMRAAAKGNLAAHNTIGYYHERQVPKHFRVPSV